VLSVTGPADGYVLAMVPLIAVAIAGMVVASFLPGRTTISARTEASAKQP